ncbi:hypothetical protein FO519_010931, partial [Halicephalobus sp. NKZ332]
MQFEQGIYDPSKLSYFNPNFVGSGGFPLGNQGHFENSTSPNELSPTTTSGTGYPESGIDS